MAPMFRNVAGLLLRRVACRQRVNVATSFVSVLCSGSIRRRDIESKKPKSARKILYINYLIVHVSCVNTDAHNSSLSVAPQMITKIYCAAIAALASQCVNIYVPYILKTYVV